MDMYYGDYEDMVNSLMIQAFLHDVNQQVQQAKTQQRLAKMQDDDEGILIDEA